MISNKSFLNVLFTVFFLCSCGGNSVVKKIDPVAATNKSCEILEFKIANYATVIEGAEITVYAPYLTDISSLVPVIVHNGQSISPASGLAQNFTNPVEYTVKAKDGTSKVYKVTVLVAQSDTKQIVVFDIDGIPNAETIINGFNITVLVPVDTDLTNLVPIIGHNGKTVSPASNLVNNFTNPVQYTVKAFDNTTNVYTVTVNCAWAAKYHAVDSTNGAVPLDETMYIEGDSMVVLGNVGALQKTHYTFNGWNTAPDGSGVNYQPGDTITFNGSSIDLYARWYGTTGVFDDSFVSGTGFDNLITTLDVDSSGKILVGGLFNNYNGNIAGHIVRLNPDGTIDDSFSSGSGFTGGDVRFIKVDNEGKILVAGLFTSYNGVQAKRIIRLNQNGSIDTSFNTGTGFNLNVYSLSIDDQGKILVGGAFTEYNGVVAPRLVRLLNTGSIDNSFNVGGSGFSANAIVNDIKVYPNGDIIVGGSFSNYNGTNLKNIVRLKNDGSVDNTFYLSALGFNNTVNSLVISPSLQIFVGGSFITYDGQTARRIVCLRGSGLRDFSFNDVGYGPSGTVINKVLVDLEGRAFLGGDFTNYNYSSANRIIKLLSDTGLRDTSFVIGSGFNDTVTSMVIDDNGKLIVGGKFTSYNGNAVNRIVRLK